MRAAVAAIGGLAVLSSVHAASRYLPPGPLNIGYAADNECDAKVTTAVHNGLNGEPWLTALRSSGRLHLAFLPSCRGDELCRYAIHVAFAHNCLLYLCRAVVIWSFIELVPDNQGNPTLDLSRAPDLDCVADVALNLQQAGLFTTHMVSVGGWAGPHPLPTTSAKQSYAMWKSWNEQTVARNGWAGFDGAWVGCFRDPSHRLLIRKMNSRRAIPASFARFCRCGLGHGGCE
jgi:hypothetical protein